MDRRSLLLLGLLGVPIGATIALAQAPSYNEPNVNQAPGANRPESNAPDPVVTDDDDDEEDEDDKDDDDGN